MVDILKWTFAVDYIGKVVNALIPIFKRHVYPFSLKSDNGRQLQSEVVPIKHSLNQTRDRTQNIHTVMVKGDVERQNRSLLKTLKVARVEGKGWKGKLMEFLLPYRTTPQSSTGVTPAFLMFGR